jgi:diaminohydroxyphosphoribosylaminopyrimidine deaminase / 5-amino-6-(5-phosphoribosylamino)uracil reductase
VPDPARATALRGLGVEVLETDGPRSALETLRERGVRSMLVEGGGALAGALLEHRLVDRLVIFRAPVVLGAGAVGGLSAAPSERLGAARRLPVLEHRAIGDDHMTVYAVSDPDI